MAYWVRWTPRETDQGDEEGTVPEHFQSYLYLPSRRRGCSQWRSDLHSGDAQGIQGAPRFRGRGPESHQGGQMSTLTGGVLLLFRCTRSDSQSQWYRRRCATGGISVNRVGGCPCARFGLRPAWLSAPLLCHQPRQTAGCSQTYGTPARRSIVISLQNCTKHPHV